MKKSIIFNESKQSLTAYSGQIFINKLWKALKLDKKFKFCLPKKKTTRGLAQVDKLKELVLSFATGGDSLSDIEVLNDDRLFNELVGGRMSDTTLASFLYSIESGHLRKLQSKLIEATLELRCALFKERKFILTMDATPHKHWGKKMEGLAWNYKNLWCLDSQNAFDQYGFSYAFDLRSGSTHSSVSAQEWIHRIYKQVPKEMESWFRADSAYGSKTIYAALNAKGVKFVIALKDNVGRSLREHNTLEWKKTDLYFFDSNDCEVASTRYVVEDRSYRVVFIRAPRPRGEQSELWDGEYLYYSFITNTESSELSVKEVIEFYRGRSTAENYIKEKKYGYDFLNFPCQKLSANRAFGFAGSLAHNLMRALGLMLEQKKVMRKDKTGQRKVVTQLGYFAKAIRRKLINIAGVVTTSARTVTVRTNYKEVAKRMIAKIMNLQQELVPLKKLCEIFDNKIPGTTSCTTLPEGG